MKTINLETKKLGRLWLSEVQHSTATQDLDSDADLSLVKDTVWSVSLGRKQYLLLAPVIDLPLRNMSGSVSLPQLQEKSGWKHTDNQLKRSSTSQLITLQLTSEYITLD